MASVPSFSQFAALGAVRAPTSARQAAALQLQQNTQQRAFNFQEQIRNMQAAAFRDAQQAQMVYSNQVSQSANDLANLTNQAVQLAADGVNLNTAMRSLDSNGRKELQQLQAQRQASLINEATRIASQIQANGVYTDQDIQQVEYARKLAEGLIQLTSQESAAAQASASAAFLQGLQADSINYSTSVSNSSGSTVRGGVTEGNLPGKSKGRKRYDAMFDDYHSVSNLGQGYQQYKYMGATEKELFAMLQTATDPWEIYQLEKKLSNFDSLGAQVDATNAANNEGIKQFNASIRQQQFDNFTPYVTDADAQRQRINTRNAFNASLAPTTNPYYRQPPNSRGNNTVGGRSLGNAIRSFEQMQPGSTTAPGTSDVRTQLGLISGAGVNQPQTLSNRVGLLSNSTRRS